MSSSGRVALITGASSGIGAATAIAFARAGLIVVLAARRGDRLNAVADQITQDGGTALPLVCDVTSDADVDFLVTETIRRFHRLDVVVCNAGIGYNGRLEETSPDAMARLMDVNFMGTFLVARAALPHLKHQRDARLIFVSSIVGQRGIAFGAAYSATKFAQTGLGEALRSELIGSSVRLSLIFPVSTETEFREAMAREQGFTVEGHGPRQPAEHVARAIVRCLTHPRPEVYPHRLSRALVVLNAIAPGLCDRVIRRFGRQPAAIQPAS
jgi:NADP-dependent 3-hydroxy acid dehydrogenase YdfG